MKAQDDFKSEAIYRKEKGITLKDNELVAACQLITGEKPLSTSSYEQALPDFPLTAQFFKCISKIIPNPWSDVPARKYIYKKSKEDKTYFE